MSMSKPQMTSAEFNSALRHAGFGVDRGHVVDVSGKCPGFAMIPTYRGRGLVDRSKTLERAIRERDSEIRRRAARAATASASPELPR
jgi:hypothetical protein